MIHLFKSNKIAILLFLVLFGSVLKFVNLDSKTFWTDEAATLFRLSGYGMAEMKSKLMDHNVYYVKDLKTYQSLNEEKGLSDTIQGLIDEDPQLPPLYYTLLYLWAKATNDHPTMLRLFSAILYLMSVIGFYWLSKVLFKSVYARWIAVSLFSVSPFFLLYAQEARLYMLWVSVTLFSSTCLLYAVKGNRRWPWLLYALLTTLSLYAYPLSIVITFGHGIYLILIREYRQRFVILFILTTLCALLLYMPWMLRIYEYAQQDENGSNVTSYHQIPAVFTVINFFINAVRAFFDIPGKFLWKATPDQYTMSDIFTGIIFLGLLGLLCRSFYAIFKYSDRKVFLFLFLMIFLLPITFMVPDLIFGGIRSIWPRYQVPCFIGLILLLANSVDRPSSDPSTRLKNITPYIFLLVGICSCVYIVNTKIWWHKYYSNDNYKIAQIINERKPGLLLLYAGHPEDAYVPMHYLFDILSLSHYLPDDQAILLVNAETLQAISNDSKCSNEVLLFNPSDRFLTHNRKAGMELLFRDREAKNRPTLSLWRGCQSVAMDVKKETSRFEL